MLIPFLILANHFFADFILQNDDMAVKKSVSFYWLTAHVLAYCAGFTPFVVFIASQTGIETALLFMGINGVLHWCTDLVTSRVNSYLWKQEKKHWFFVNIGFDQLIHYACLLFSYQWLVM